MGVNKNFVVKNGLEVSNDLILANAEKNRVGIGTSFPTHLLHVNGGIAATHVSVSGVTTVNSLVLQGPISVANTFGKSFQYLRSDGFGGVEWAGLPELRTSVSYTAIEGQTDFEYIPTVAYIDVFVNGVKLTESSYNYISGVRIVLLHPAFENDVIEIIGYTSNTVGSSGPGTIAGITILEDGNLRGVPGFVTSINFVGPTVDVESSGFGVTVYSLNGTGFGDSFWEETGTGISTTSNVGIGTTNAVNALTVIGNASISGITTLGISFVGSSSSETSLTVDGGITATGVVTAFYYEGDGSRLTGIIAEAIDTGWFNNPPIGISTTAKVGIGTTNPQYQLEIAEFGSIGTQLYVNGGIEATSNISIGGSLTAIGGVKAGKIFIEEDLIDSQELISIGGTAVRILGDLYVDGDRIETNIVELQVDDKIVGLGTTSEPLDVNADGGGIVLYGDSVKEFLWNFSTNSWTSNVNFDLELNNSYKINGENRLSYELLSVPNANISGIVTANNINVTNLTASLPINAPSFIGSGNALTGIVTSIIAGSNISINQSTGRVIISASGTGGGDGSSVTISDTPPSDPFSGDLWYDSVLGRGFIYYVDDDSSQWVDFSPNGGVPSNSISIEKDGLPLPQAISTINFTGNVSITTSIAGIATIGINTDVASSGIEIQENGSLLGTALSLNFAENLSVDFSSGIATISATGGGEESYWTETTAGIHTLSNVGIGTTNPTSALTVNGDANISGVVTATSFFGDGSGLTGVVGSGSGVVVKDSGSTIGTAGTIDFGNNLSVSPISAGIVTVTASGGFGDVFWAQTTAGIHTLSNVGIGTTNPTSKLTVSGDANISGILTVGTASITLDGSSNTITVGSGVTIGGSTGIITATSFVGALTGTATSTTNIPNLTGDITSVNNVTAIATGAIVNADINANAAIADTKLATIATAGKVSNSATTATNANTANTIVVRDASGNFSAGTITATSFSGSGANLTNLPASSITWQISSSGSTDYVFSGPGIVSGNTNDPILYLYRGFTYVFVNNTGSSHPFAIRESAGGSDYTPGVTGSQTGTQTFVVPMNAPSTLYYQCTIHSGMGNVINIV